MGSPVFRKEIATFLKKLAKYYDVTYIFNTCKAFLVLWTLCVPSFITMSYIVWDKNIGW